MCIHQITTTSEQSTKPVCIIHCQQFSSAAGKLVVDRAINTQYHLLPQLCWNRIAMNFPYDINGQWPISQIFFVRNSNSMENAPCCNSEISLQIVTR